MHNVTWLVPIRLTRCDRKSLMLATIAKLDGQKVAMQDYGYSVKRIAVPRHGFARF
jgi:hypothetical protein